MGRKRKEKANLVGVDEESSDVCRESGYITAVFMNGLRSVEGDGPAASERCHSGSGVLRLRWFIRAPESCCQPGSGPVWESNLERIERVTCDNVHPAREPGDHIDNVRFIRPRRGSNYEQPCSARAELDSSTTTTTFPHFSDLIPVSVARTIPWDLM